jgi:hypothetical protein
VIVSLPARCYYSSVPHWNSSTVAYGLQILQGLLTPVIAVVAAFIAWQQWKVNERKFKFEQYERRLRIYQEVLGVLTLVTRDFNPEFINLQEFRAATAEADFLFEPEISKYLDEIVRRGLKLWSAHSQYRAINQVRPPGYDHQKVINEIKEQENWFMEQSECNAAKQKFQKYLDVSR